MRTRRRPRRSAFKWLWFNGSSEILRLLGHPFIRVRYEDLVRDPEPILRACLSHAGSPAGEGDLAFLGDGVARLSSGHLVAGNRMRTASGNVHLRIDEAWRDQLPEREQRQVVFVTRPLLRRYGYG